ncbi:hypothetical protein KR009_008998 [Drosophila setifemur]|nr:hypothetical protein KR009_008998 [Drosophila setifemur]
MDLNNSTPNNIQKHNELFVDTAVMNSEDFSEVLQMNAEIEDRRRSRQQQDTSMATGLLRSTKTREEIFEFTALDDDSFLPALENQNSYVISGQVQITDLDLSSIENLMKYFDEEVPVTPTKILKPSKTSYSDKVVNTIAKLGLQSVPVTPPKRRVGCGNVKIRKLKQKYEQQTETPLSGSGRIGKLTSGTLSKKVKEMVDLFNSKISQVMHRVEEPPYLQLQNELSPVANSNPHSRVKPKSPLHGPCLVAEEVFHELSVRDKALLLNKFVCDMAAKHPKFTAHAKGLRANAKKQMGCGEVVAERQSSVRYLTKELEAKCVVEQGSSPQPKVCSPFKKTEVHADALIHVSSLMVTLKPSPDRRLEGQSVKHSGKGSLKRNLAAIRRVLITEAYAPPKKIWRTRQERCEMDTHLLESLFYSWLSTENGVQFDINSMANSQLSIQIGTADRDLKDQPISEQNEGTMAVSQKSAVERQNGRTEEAIAKLEMENNDEKNSNVGEKELDTPQTELQGQGTAHRVKRRAPPVPGPRPRLSQSLCMVPISSNASSFKQSEGEESESGLSTLPKITSDESQPETTKEDKQPLNFAFAKPQRPPRKKKMRRALTWKKENSIVEATANAITLTDSESDCKPATMAPTKKKTGVCLNLPLMEENYNNLDNSLLRQVNSPRKIKSAYTLTAMSSPSPNADSDHSSAQTPRQSLGQYMRDNLIDQGFETCSNDPMDGPLRCSFLGREGSRPSGFSTPVKGRLASNPAQQQLFSPILAQEKSRRSSVAMKVIREDHLRDLDATSSTPTTPGSEKGFFCSAPVAEINFSQEDEMAATKPHSLLWISAGDFTISLEIFHNSSERLKLLYEIFSQRSWETQDLAFGIDGQKFMQVDGRSDAARQRVPHHPPTEQGCSHYWFANGDITVPFLGKLMCAGKVERLFSFLDAEQSALRFGVDHIEFSRAPEFWHTTQKYSIESSYSMLVGLQTGASNGQEGRNKYAWPNSYRNAFRTIKTSDLDQTEFESDSFSNNSGRLSFSPDLFSVDYEAVPLDELFAKRTPTTATPVMPMTKTIQILKQQQSNLQAVEQRIPSYAKPSNLANFSLEACRNTPEYIHNLRSIIRAIDNIGCENGFRVCSTEQLESFMYFLSEYADVCLATCSVHINKILDTLLDRQAAV